MKEKRRFSLLIASVVGLAGLVITSGSVAAAESGSACLNCHTDLAKMDKLSAQGGAGAGEIAG